MKKIKRPIKKSFCKPFSLDDKFVCFDSKSYSKKADLYINQLEKEHNELLEICKKLLVQKDKAVDIYKDVKFTVGMANTILEMQDFLKDNKFSLAVPARSAGLLQTV